MNLKEILNSLLPKIETHLQDFINAQDFNHSQMLKEMLTYQMGWEEEGSKGKRIRPSLVLLTAKALGGEIQKTMPAALSVEFLHNFTLIHDDIEDQSLYRHNRPTLWQRWGIAQAINAGDALFSIAQLAMLDLENTCGSSIAVKALNDLNQTCFHLTRGQSMDIAYETDQSVSPSAYLEMISGKTGALLGLSAGLGGLTSGQNDPTIDFLFEFGKSLGMAFQIKDDILGIWGDPGKTGKSASSDLQSRKKTLPILYGLEQSQNFRNMWEMKDLSKTQIQQMAEILEDCGAKIAAHQEAKSYTLQAFAALENLFPSSSDRNDEAAALFELTDELLKREV